MAQPANLLFGVPFIFLLFVYKILEPVEPPTVRALKGQKSISFHVCVEMSTTAE